MNGSHPTAIRSNPNEESWIPAARPVLKRNNDDCVPIRAELDSYYQELQKLNSLEADEVMAKLSAIIARLIQVRASLMRADTRAATSLRTQEIDPLMDALKLIFQMQSRRVSLRQLEWETTR